MTTATIPPSRFTFIGLQKSNENNTFHSGRILTEYKWIHVSSSN